MVRFPRSLEPISHWAARGVTDRATADGSGGHVLDPDTAVTLRGGFAVGFVEP